MTVTIPIFVRFTDAGLSISAPEWVWWVVGALLAFIVGAALSRRWLLHMLTNAIASDISSSNFSLRSISQMSAHLGMISESSADSVAHTSEVVKRLEFLLINIESELASIRSELDRKSTPR